MTPPNSAPDERIKFVTEDGTEVLVKSEEAGIVEDAGFDPITGRSLHRAPDERMGEIEKLVAELRKMAGSFYFAAGTANTPDDDPIRQNVLIMMGLLNRSADHLAQHRALMQENERLKAENAAQAKVIEHDAARHYALTAQLARLKTAAGWCDIESAPKDGTEILIAHDCGGDAWQFNVVYWDDSNGKSHPWCMVEGDRYAAGFPHRWRSLDDDARALAQATTEKGEG